MSSSWKGSKLLDVGWQATAPMLLLLVHRLLAAPIVTADSAIAGAREGGARCGEVSSCWRRCLACSALFGRPERL